MEKEKVGAGGTSKTCMAQNNCVAIKSLRPLLPHSTLALNSLKKSIALCCQYKPRGYTSVLLILGTENTENPCESKPIICVELSLNNNLRSGLKATATVVFYLASRMNIYRANRDSLWALIGRGHGGLNW